MTAYARACPVRVDARCPGVLGCLLVGGVTQAELDIRLLGDIDVRSAGVRLDLGTRKQRALLTMLALSGGRVVAADRLVDELWGDTAPARPMASLHPYVSNLRRLLEPFDGQRNRPTRLITTPPGYCLIVDVEEVDVLRFEAAARRVEDLLAVGRHGDAEDVAAQALALWRGDALGEFASELFAAGDAARLEDLRLTTEENLFEARLQRRDPALAADLTRFAATHPLRERACLLLMHALYRSGRPSDAIQAFDRVRRYLVDTVGVDPALELRELAEAIRRGDASPEATIPPPRIVMPPSHATVERVDDRVAPPGRRAAPDHVAVFGRDDALALATAALADAARSTPRVVVVTGEAGIGKSRLIDEVSEQAVAQGFDVARGTCDDDGRSPFGPWHDVLDALGEQVDGLTSVDADVLDVQAAHRRLIEEISTSVCAAASHRPLVIVLEDLHWADSSSLRCLEVLTRHAWSERLLVIASCRPDRGADASQTIGSLARSPSFVRIELEGLSADALGELVRHHAGRDLDDLELELIAERTRGNPFFAIELARWLGRQPGGQGVPVGVIDVVRRRLGLLPDEAARVVTIAALIGHTFELEVLERASRLEPDELFDLVDIAVVDRLVEPVDDRPTAYRFVHAIVRDAVAHDIPPLRRGRLHHRIAEALAQHGSASTELTVHRWEARAVAPDKARAECERAARRAEARYATSDASAWWERALSLEASDSSARPAILLNLGRSLERQSLRRTKPGGGTGADPRVRFPTSVAPQGHDLPPSWEYLVEAIDGALLHDDFDTAAAAATAFGADWNGWHWSGLRTVPVAPVQRLHDVLARIPRSDRATRARILAKLAVGLYGDADVVPSDELSAEAVEIARRIGDRRLLAGVLLSRVLGIQRPGRDHDQRAYIDELLQLDALAPEHHAAALLLRAGLDLRAAQRAPAERAVDEARDLARSAGLVWAEVQADLIASVLAIIDGDLRRAESILRDIQVGARDLVVADVARIKVFVVYCLRHAQGQLAQLAPVLMPSMDQIPVARLDLIGPVLLALDRAADARSLTLDPPMRADPPSDWLWPIDAVLRAQVAVGLHDVDLARQQYERLQPHSRTLAIASGIVVLGPIDQALGELAGSFGDDAAAGEHFRRAIDTSMRVGAPVWEARARASLDQLASQ